MRLAVIACTAIALAFPLAAQEPAHRALEREILRELIEINTSDSGGGTMAATQALARRLREAGLPTADVHVLEPGPRQGMLVARYRGTGRAGRPILLMAHLDVVDARAEDWSMEPYTFHEADGYYYGRGTNDNKAGAATLVANFIRYRREGFVPDRDLVIVLTSDEETGQTSIKWVLERHRDLVDAEFALNTDAGGGELKDGKPITFAVQAAEKLYQSYRLDVRNRGGHSSVPESPNAIYQLSEALLRISRHVFPVHLTEVSRAYFARSAAGQEPETAAAMRALAERDDPAAAARLATVPYYNGVMRTTCVATELFAGHAENALPQLARATVNCRLVPGESPDSVRAILARLTADTAVRVTPVDEPNPSPPSPLTPAVMEPIERLAREMWPAAVVIPEQSTGGTDGIYTRNAGIPTYGVSALFDEVGDVRAHGRDERVGVQSYHDAAEYWYRLVKRLATARPGT
ncbi:MAG TPA: M20/M25/M40 family metallo-hydrolase [Gemmatimonadales bacterium]|nr:M20/M25/M40 family metallo-hydrolase [Gemmatimonadales bacterium]